MDNLTDRERAFLTFYMQHNDRERAYVDAGYSDQGRKGNMQRSLEILKRPHVEAAMRAKTEQLAASKGLGVNEVLSYFIDIYKESMETSDLGNANRAMENVGKHLGMFVEQKKIDVTEKRELPENEEEADAEIKALLRQLDDDDLDNKKLLEARPAGNG